MDTKIQLDGLNHFLADTHSEKIDLQALIESLGFDITQTALLIGKQSAIANQFIAVIRDHLSLGDKHLYFELLARQYGLDGKPPESLEAISRAMKIDLQYTEYSAKEALQKCSTKTASQNFQKELKRITLEILGTSIAPPEKEDIVSKLNRLADLQAALDLANMDYEAKRTEIMKQVQDQLDALEAEYDPILDAASENFASLEAEIKNDVLLHKESVNTDLYQAVYAKGRVSWDTKGMDSYAKSHPDILAFRKEGQPSVSLRLKAQKGDTSSDE